MTEPQVTIVVAPRERFSCTRESLESIYEHTQLPFSLIYVDGNSPPPTQRYLEAQAREKEFQLIRTDYYLSPNQARNIGLRQVQGTPPDKGGACLDINSKYVVFIDNDVIVSPGWLNQLIECAEETGALVVGPLTCIGKPVHETVYLAGGEAHTVVEVEGEIAKRRMHEKHYFVNRRVVDVRDQLKRRQCELAKFHCVLVRTEVFERIGLLDEALLNTREHIDFCITVAEAGGTIYCEPAAVVTYVRTPLKLSDFHYYMLRWSDAWELASLEHFCKKWDLSNKDKYFKKRYKRLEQRRHQTILRPLIRQIAFGQNSPWLEKMLLPMERSLNHYLTSRYAQSQSPSRSTQASMPSPSHKLLGTVSTGS